MKILAIDDRPDNLTVLKAVLLDRLPDSALVTALDGPKGLELAASEDPDVILLDIVMPGMDGYDVCRRLKADALLKAIPVLFLTAHTDRDSRIQAVEAGADGFLSKPFDELELTVQIRAMTKLKAANRLQRLEKEDLTALVAERTRELERELAERKKAESYREITREVLQILNGSGDFQSSLRRILSVVKTRTGFDAVGIRLQDGEDFPYFIQDGFSKEFLRTQNSLLSRIEDGGVCRDKDGKPCLECSCGLVISGGVPKTNSLFTAGGSFWTNNSPTLLDIPADKDPRLHPRNMCIRCGYASVALIPIRTQDKIVGLIQLNDRSKDRFTIEIVELMEGIAAHIGEALVRKQAEELLRSSEERYRKLVDNLDAGVVMHGPDTSVITSNSRALELLGLSEDQMAGRQAMDPEWKFLHEDHAPFLIQEFPVSRIIAEKKAIKNLVLGIVRPVSKDIVWVSVNGVPVFDQQGDILQVVVSFVDITERKQAEEALQESEKRMRAITDSAQDAIVMMDPEGRICYWNAAAERIFGYTSEEALGGNLHALIAPARYHAAHNAAFPAFLKSGQGNAIGKTLEMEALRKDGSEISVELSLSAIQVQGNWHAVGIIRDITERKAMEAGLKEALHLAEVAAAAKSEFLSIMSHELRTPLNGVLGFSELLADTPLDEEQRSCVETISNSGDHLLAIVNDILDFSSIEKGAMAIHVEPFDFDGLVKSSEQAVQKTALDKGIAFRSVIEPGVPEQIPGDERRIRQILINLLGNAVKFTSNGSVTLRVATVKIEGRQFLDFSVEDTGIGMSPETIALLFNPFTQADMRRNRTFGGTGLGLAISQRLAEAMGGKITVISTPGQGSTFTFRLPLETSPPSSAPATPAHCGSDSAQPSGALVLVVEDDKTSITLMGKILQSLGYRAEFAADGAEAVRTFEPGKYSAILMDMAMPVMDGIEATKIIRERESGSRIPIIALTANVMPDDRERCHAAGMDDFVSKPFKKDELAATLARVLQPPQ